MNFLRVEKNFEFRQALDVLKTEITLLKNLLKYFQHPSVEIFPPQRVMNSAAATLSGSPIWLKTSSALELKSKCELLELATLPLSHFSVLDWTDVIWLHLRMRQINAGDKSPDSRIFRKMTVRWRWWRQTDRPVLLFPASLQVSWSAGYNVTILWSLTAFVPEIQVVKWDCIHFKIWKISIDCNLFAAGPEERREL